MLSDEVICDYKIGFLMFGLFFISACASGVTPRQNFDWHLSATKGKNLKEIENSQWEFGFKEELIKQEILPNGNVDHYYKKRFPQGNCVYVLQTDQNTDNIVGARIDGDTKACVIAP